MSDREGGRERGRERERGGDRRPGLLEPSLCTVLIYLAITQTTERSRERGRHVKEIGRASCRERV